jgi:RNA-directed DNA polymerase
MMNERGKSDRPVVPVKSSNKAEQSAAEGMEGRGLTKGNPLEQNASRTQSRSKGVSSDRSSSLGSLDAPSALERIRQAASKDKEMRFTALSHHIYPFEALRTAYL